MAGNKKNEKKKSNEKKYEVVEVTTPDGVRKGWMIIRRVDKAVILPTAWHEDAVRGTCDDLNSGLCDE